MLYFLIVFLVAGLAIEVFSLLDGLKHIFFQCKPEKHQAEQGEVVNITAQVTNQSLLPVNYLCGTIAYPIAAQLPPDLKPHKEQFFQTVDTVFRLWGYQRVKRNIPVVIDKRGVHYFKGAILHRGDFLGLRLVSEQYMQTEQLLIYPKCLNSVKLSAAMSAYCADMIAHRHLLRDPILTMGVREYTGTEPMKTISWTQTAHRAQLMVREFDYTRDMSCTVILATDGMMPTSEIKLDRCCSLVRTVCRELTDRHIRVDFHTNCPILSEGWQNNGIVRCSASNENEQDLLRILALLFPAPVQCAAQRMTATVAKSTEGHAAFVIVSPFDTQEVRATAKQLEESTGMPVLLLVEDDFPDVTGECDKE